MVGGTISKVQRAKLENQIRAEIEKQVSLINEQLRAKYQKQLTERLKTDCDAVRKTYEQYQVDTAVIALNQLGWGETRITRFLDEWNSVYDQMFHAMTLDDEADYARVNLDRKLKEIFKSGEIPSFEKRYEYLPDITYTISEGDDKQHGNT